MHLLQPSFTLFLMLALGCAPGVLGIEPEVTDRILGGHVEDIISLPYQVGLKIEKRRNGKLVRSSLCGGSIIRKNFILTAAHCIGQMDDTLDPVRTDDILVFANHSSLGSETKQSGTPHVKKVYTLPETKITPAAAFNCHHINGDVAILELTNPLPLGPGIQVIPLAKANTKLQEGAKARISGYGVTQNKQEHGQAPKKALLYAAEVAIVADKDCRECFTGGVPGDATFCAGTGGERRTVGTFHGDSGGPLAVNGVLEGVTSCGPPSKDCPDLFVRIASQRIRTFIESVAGV